MLGDPMTDIDITMEIDYFRLARDRYFVPIVAKIPGSELELARHGGAESTTIDFIGEIKDAAGKQVANVRDFADFKLKGETAAELPNIPSNTTPASRCRPENIRCVLWRAKIPPAKSAPTMPNSRFRT